MRRVIVDEPVAVAARWSRRLAVFAAAIAGVAIALARFHAVNPPAALTVFAAALVIAAIAVRARRIRGRHDLARRAQGRGTGRIRLRSRRGAARLPRLARHRRLRPAADQSGLDRPRIASAVHAVDQGAPARAGTEPPALNDETIAAQRAVYPDIETVKVEMDPTEAYRLALGAASDLGWRIVDAEPPNLAGDGSALIEAADRSLFFSLVTDIAIRIRPGATRTAIDVRCVSRLGKHDFGANAARVRRFIAAVNEGAGQR